MKTIQLAVLLQIAFMVRPAGGQTTDFEDLSVGAAFTPGSTINSGGLSFDVISFNGRGSTVFVQNATNTIGSGIALFLANDIGLDIQIPAGVSGASFDYGAFCCGSGIVVNGDASALSGSFSSLDGTTLGGVSIAVSVTTTGNEIGSVSLSGPIHSLVIGGVELFVDNVSLVPEPSTLLYAVLVIFGWLGLRVGRRLIA